MIHFRLSSNPFPSFSSLSFFFLSRRIPSSVARSRVNRYQRGRCTGSSDGENETGRKGHGVEGRGVRVVFEGDVSFVGSRFHPPPLHPQVPKHNLRPSGPSLSHPSLPPSTTRWSSLILCSTGAALSTHLRCKTSPSPPPPRCRDVNAREMGWRGCENVAWAVTRVHAGKLFLFICSMLPWRIDISHEFTWGKRRGKEGRGKGKEKGKEEGRRSSPWRGRGRRTISFSAFSQNDAYFSYVSCFPPPPSHPSSSQRTKRWYEERILCNDGSFDHEQGSSRELLLLFFYYSWNTRIVKMEIRIDKCKFDVANFLLSIHFSLEK